MYEAVQHCKHCGAGLTLEDLRQPNCKFCKTVLPHHAQAAQHAHVASQMMGQMMQQQAAIQDQWRGALGVGPMPPMGQPGPPGPPGGAAPGAPVNPQAYYGAGMAQANAVSKMVMWIIIGSVVLALIVTVGAGMLFAFVR